MFFLIYSCKTGKCWNHNVFTNLQILTPTLWLLSLPSFLPGKNSPSIAKSNRVFSGKGRGDKSLILTYLDSPMAEVLSSLLLIFFDCGHLQVKTGGQSWTKSANFGSLFFSWKFEAFKFFSNNVFICWSTTSGENFGNIGPYLGEKGPKTSQKGSFHGFWIGTKNFENF